MKKNIVAIVAILFSLVSCISTKPNIKTTKDYETDKRLLSSVVPIKYELNLWARLKSDEFNGQVIIDIHVLEQRDHILMHGKDLVVTSIGLQGPNGDQDAKFTVLDDTGLARVDFGQSIEPGRYRLEISYDAKYSKDLSGLYKIKDGDEHYLYTQFEPLDARRMLPCFDEPRWKTPFDIKVVSEAGQTVVANSSLKSLNTQNGDEVHIFQTTKPMPTYLLALAVGPFDVMEGPLLMKNRYRSEDIRFRGIATKGKGGKLSFALEETPMIVLKLEEYFGIAYPYDKLDILAVPDFFAGAMENVGAITFREWYVLLDEQAPVDQRHDFYSVMTHELAHQWFGNLVTMPWWDDIWLNEAFATWLSSKIVNDIKPQFKSASNLLLDSHSAMAHDSLLAARKIREPIMSTHDIKNAFDRITYNKGGAVLSMLENYLGPEKFRDAVSSHMKKFQFGTASSRDFFLSLAQFSDPSLITSAESFLNQTGVPRIRFSHSCNNKGLLVSMEQSRYVPIGSKIDPSGKWDIPLCIGYEAAGKIKKRCFNVDKPEMFVIISTEKCPAFVIPNFDGQGYYRFSLVEKDWENLIDQRARLNEVTRIAIADSLLGELYAGTARFSFVAEGLYRLVDARSSSITSYFSRLIKQANNFWVNDENRASLVAFAQDKMKSIYHGLSSRKVLDEDQRALKKDLAAFLAHVVKDKETRLDLSIIGHKYLEQVILDESEMNKEPLNLDDDLLSEAISVDIEYRDETAIDKIIARLSDLSDSVLRSHVLSGLAKGREGLAAEKIRSLVFNKSLRQNEQLSLFADHLEKNSNQPATWEFLKANKNAFKSALNKDQLAYLPYLAHGLCSKEHAAEVKAYFSPWIKEYDGGPRNLQAVVEQIEICSSRKEHTSVLANQFFKDLQEKTVVVRD